MFGSILGVYPLKFRPFFVVGISNELVHESWPLIALIAYGIAMESPFYFYG